MSGPETGGLFENLGQIHKDNKDDPILHTLMPIILAVHGGAMCIVKFTISHLWVGERGPCGSRFHFNFSLPTYSDEECNDYCLAYNDCMHFRESVTTQYVWPNPDCGPAYPQEGPYYFVWGRIMCEKCAMTVKRHFDKIFAKARLPRVRIQELTFITDDYKWLTGMNVNVFDVACAITIMIEQSRQAMAQCIGDMVSATTEMQRIRLDTSYTSGLKCRGVYHDHARNFWIETRNIWKLFEQHMAIPEQCWDDANGPSWRPDETIRVSRLLGSIAEDSAEDSAEEVD